MISHDYAGAPQRGFSGELIPSPQVESPLALPQGTQHLLCPCMYMYILHVDTCASPHTGKVELGTPNRTPQNHNLPIW